MRLDASYKPTPIPGGSANAYTYTFGDPVNTTDPSSELTYGFSSWLKEANNQEAKKSLPEKSHVGQRLALLGGAQDVGRVALEVVALHAETEEAAQRRDRARLARWAGRCVASCARKRRSSGVQISSRSRRAMLSRRKSWLLRIARRCSSE